MEAPKDKARDIPAHEVFARHATPLHLPKLDELLDTLPLPSFSEPSKILGKCEQAAWEAFIEPELSLWAKVRRLWSRRRNKKISASKVDERALTSDRSDFGPENAESSDKTLAFLPAIFLPKDLTIARLKLNRHTPSTAVTLHSVLGTAIDTVLGAEGSQFFSNMTTVEMFRDFMQMLSLLLSSSSSSLSRWDISGSEVATEADRWQSIVFGKLPAILAFDFVSAFGKAILWFWLFNCIAFLAVWEFTCMSGGWKRMPDRGRDSGEGFDREERDENLDQSGVCRRTVLQHIRQSRGYRIFVVFVGTTLYMPISKVCIGALVWSSDFWAIENPYATSDDPHLDQIGTKNRRAQSNFCYTTTMLKQDGLRHFNWAWIIVPCAVLSILWLTIYFPLRIWFAVQRAIPRPDPYTEFGRKRSNTRAEYERLLSEDQHPLAFLYAAYRRPWCGFKSIYMAVKLLNVIARELISKDNCLFKGVARSRMVVVSQSVQVVVMILFLVAEVYASPFIDRRSNNSDWISRIGYVLIALFGLLVALDAPGKAALQDWAPTLVTFCIYAFNIWFACISKTFFKGWMKILQRRIDFSIDIFSPHLDLSKHIARRIWQEAICTILLAAPDFSMPRNGSLDFAREPGCAPYLLAFTGTQAERLIENVKVITRKLPITNLNY